MRIRKVYTSPYSKPKKKGGSLLKKAALAGALTAALYVGEKARHLDYSVFHEKPQFDIEEVMEKEDGTKYKWMVYSSNTDPALAERNVESLRRKNIDAQVAPPVEVDGKQFHRTVIPQAIQEGESELEFITRVASIDGNDIYLSQYPESSFEGLDKGEYVDLIDNHIMTLHNARKFKKQITLEEARAKAEKIYDAAREFDIPLLTYTSILEQESNFRDVEGDTKLRPNHSEGMGQMRIETQKYALEKFREMGFTDFPEKKPETILGDDDLQSRLYAGYIRLNIDRAGGSVPWAVEKYNQGHNDSTFDNADYTREVLARQRKLEKKWKEYKLQLAQQEYRANQL